MQKFFRQLTVSQFAQFTDLPVGRVNSWVRNGTLPAFKLGGIWYLDMGRICTEISKSPPQFHIGKYQNRIM
jgi:hypothetical protein